MTVGRSEQANTLTVERERNVLSAAGWVPSVIFFFSDNIPSNMNESSCITIYSELHIQNACVVCLANVQLLV